MCEMVGMYPSPRGDEMQRITPEEKLDEVLVYPSPRGDEMQLRRWTITFWKQVVYPSLRGDEMQLGRLQKIFRQLVNVSVPAWG